MPNLTRLLIRLRRPMTAIAAAAAALMLGTNWYRFIIGIPLPVIDGEPIIYLDAGAIDFSWYVGAGRPILELRDASGFPGPSEWIWWFQFDSAPNVRWSVSVPLWAVALSAASLAAAGFRGSRRSQLPGACGGCKYPLHGATACPECGRLAASPR